VIRFPAAVGMREGDADAYLGSQPSVGTRRSVEGLLKSGSDRFVASMPCWGHQACVFSAAAGSVCVSFPRDSF
jgi:hypothetical protein